jgi:hypothetical protein
MMLANNFNALEKFSVTLSRLGLVKERYRFFDAIAKRHGWS